MSTTDSITPESRRFSIRLPRPLWIGLAAAALFVVAVGTHVGLAIYPQEVAIREIGRLGGIVAAEPRGPNWLRYVLGDNRLARFGDVVQVNLRGKLATDATLRHVGRFKHLEILELTNTQVTDAGLEHLKGMTNLRDLHLGGTQVTDAGVAGLQQALPRLRIIPE